jgi:hypothetical protein
MQRFMTPLHSSKNLVPLAFDIGAVGVKVKLESCGRENTLAHGHLFRNRDSNAYRHDAKIRDDFHFSIVTGAKIKPGSSPGEATSSDPDPIVPLPSRRTYQEGEEGISPSFASCGGQNK